MKGVSFLEQLFLAHIAFQKAVCTVPHPSYGRVLLLGSVGVHAEDALDALDTFEELGLVTVISADDSEDAASLYTVSNKGLEELKKVGLYPIERSIPSIFK